MGGALATLAALRFANAAAADARVCTIGSPRVGDADFVAAFNHRLGSWSLRYVHDQDVVTHVAPESLRICGVDLQYRHVDAERFIDATGVVDRTTSPRRHFFSILFSHPARIAELYRAFDSSVLTRPLTAFLDHMPKAYAIAIWNDLDRHGLLP
jgi:hypothetical protein